VEAFPVGTGSGCAGNAANGNGNGNAVSPGVPIATGTVASVSGTAASTGATASVTLAVSSADAGILACYASAGDVAITLMPGTGSG
jgi:hypothetical protein